MSIILIAQTDSAPVDLTSWTKVVETDKYYNLGNNNPVDYNFSGDTIKKGVLINIGGSNYQAISDTAITGTPSDYVKITPSGSTASAAYVSSLSGVSWNDTYNFYDDVSGNAYLFNEAKETMSNPKTIIGKFAEHAYLQRLSILSSDEIFDAVLVSSGVYAQAGSQYHDYRGVQRDSTFNGGFRVNIHSSLASAGSNDIHYTISTLKNNLTVGEDILDIADDLVTSYKPLFVNGKLTVDSSLVTFNAAFFDSGVYAQAGSQYHDYRSVPRDSTFNGGFRVSIHSPLASSGSNDIHYTISTLKSNLTVGEDILDIADDLVTSYKPLFVNGKLTVDSSLVTFNAAFFDSGVYAQAGSQYHDYRSVPRDSSFNCGFRVNIHSALASSGSNDIHYTISTLKSNLTVGEDIIDIADDGVLLNKNLNMDANINPTTTPGETTTATLSTNGATAIIPRGTFYIKSTAITTGTASIFLEKFIGSEWIVVDSKTIQVFSQSVMLGGWEYSSGLSTGSGALRLRLVISSGTASASAVLSKS